MGQKVNPNGLRLGINKDWEAKWYANNTDFSKVLEKDIKIRKYLEENLKNAGIAKVVITGIGNYINEIRVEFKIIKPETSEPDIPEIGGEESAE